MSPAGRRAAAPVRRAIRPGLFAVLAITLAASGWIALGPADPEPAVPAVAAPPQRPWVGASGGGDRPAPGAGDREPAATDSTAAVLPRNRADWPLPDPIAAAAWGEPRPAPPAASVVDTSPGRNPVPDPAWRLIGAENDGATSRAFLMAGARTLVVRAGDLVDGQWQVVSIEDQHVTLRWSDGQERVLAYATR